MTFFVIVQHKNRKQRKNVIAHKTLLEGSKRDRDSDIVETRKSKEIKIIGRTVR